MKPVRGWMLIVMVMLLPAGAAVSASVEGFRPDYTDRTIIAERKFADVRFVMGAGRAMKWLEMYAGGNFVAAFRDFEAQEIHASPDGKYFLAVSNVKSSVLAFAVLDRAGHILLSGTQGESRPNTHASHLLRYCSRPAGGDRYWIDAKSPGAKFTLKAAPPGSQWIQSLSVSVRGCDGKALQLGVAQMPDRKPPPAMRLVGNPGIDGSAGERSTFHIGETIANLRGLDPSFGTRTLTLIDGRRSVQPAPAADPQKPEPAAER